MDTKNPTITEHVFERAGLGRAPFRLVGYERLTFQACPGAPVQPGGCCDFCGTGIMDAFRIRSADGRTFKVGSDCVAKTGDAGLRKAIDAETRKINRAKREAKSIALAAEVKELAADPAVRAALEALPHPLGFVDRETGRPLTAWDDVEWRWPRCGAKGLAGLAKRLRAMKAGAS
jgi:hypothetical protein